MANSPWKMPNPRKKTTKLSFAKKVAAKRSARKAVRHYPNLVDNMRAAADKKKRKSKK